MPNDPDSRPTEAELRAFIGPNAEKYWHRWRWYIENDRESARGLWPPFLFNFNWFLYRRMHREMWIPIALVFVVGAVQEAIEVFIELLQGAPYSTPILVDMAINICLGLFTSWLGSSLYFRKFRNAVRQARQMPNPQAALRSLRRAGGTCPLAAGIGVVATIGLFVMGLL